MPPPPPRVSQVTVEKSKSELAKEAPSTGATKRLIVQEANTVQPLDKEKEASLLQTSAWASALRSDNFDKESTTQMAMGQSPVPPVNIPIPTKIDKNGWCTYPKMVPLVLTHGQITLEKGLSEARTVCF